MTLYTVEQARAIEEHKASLEQKNSTITVLQSRLAALEQTVERLLSREEKP